MHSLLHPMDVNADGMTEDTQSTGTTNKLYARVAIEKAAYSFDRLFDYSIPSELAGAVKPGCRVLVPFGRGTQRRQGIVFALSDHIEDGCEVSLIKDIGSVLDREPVLSEELLLLAKWLAETCYCTLFEAAKVMLPTGLNLRMVRAYRAVSGVTLEQIDNTDSLNRTERMMASYLVSSGAAVERDRLLSVMGLTDDSDIPERLVKLGLVERTDDAVRKTGDKTVKMARLCDDVEPEQYDRLSPKQAEIVKLLEQAGAMTVKELCYFTGIGSSVVTTLSKRGVVELYRQEVLRAPSEGDGVPQPKVSALVLTDEQQAAYEHMLERYRSGAASTTLLYGVTGSGKTSVYLRLIDDVVAEDRGVIVMVPEIALTPQTIGLFRKRYGSKTALFHSGLSMGQRMDEWKRVRNGEATIAIGTRSAVFAPVHKLGLIIIDEEQEYTYKSEMTPRYHTRDVARFRCGYHKIPLVLASATPSVESYYYATEGRRYMLERLTARYGNAVLPVVQTVDISDVSRSRSIISEPLRDAIAENLRNGNQTILLHNRRGYHTFASCRACGKVLMCESCSVSMTYHFDTQRLMCHYCGASQPIARSCPYCGSEEVRYAGQGTQRVEQELAEMFPEARLLRMDADTTATRCAHADRLAAFARGEYDIMLGTQMVAKGLDFERVTLVGVLMADQALYGDDFRSFERAFSLLTQVVGRSGRGNTKGRAIIQTMTPDNPIISMATRQDYDEFYKSEIGIRRSMLYPPFSDICLVGFVGEEQQTAKDMSKGFAELFSQRAAADYPELPIRMLGPSPAAINKVQGKYRYRIILKCRSSRSLRELMSGVLKEISQKKEYKESQAFIDMNPDSVM